MDFRYIRDASGKGNVSMLSSISVRFPVSGEVENGKIAFRPLSSFSISGDWLTRSGRAELVTLYFFKTSSYSLLVGSGMYSGTELIPDDSQPAIPVSILLRKGESPDNDS